MAGRGAPIGNDYARKGRQFAEGLKRALARDDYKLFNQGCAAIARAFARGQPWAAQMVAERLDGKPMPMLPDGGDGQVVISWMGAAIAHVSQQQLPSHQPLVIDQHPLEGSPAVIEAAGTPNGKSEGG